MHIIVALRRNFAVVISVSCSPTPRQKPALKVAVIHFPTAPPCSTKVDVLQTGDVPNLFSLPQMKNVVMTIAMDPKGDKHYMFSFWPVLLSS